jgi:hypothetical protein
VLREDNRAIFCAASLASKAADWLLARHAAFEAGDSGGVTPISEYLIAGDDPELPELSADEGEG